MLNKQTSISDRKQRVVAAIAYPLTITVFLLFFVAIWRIASLPNPTELSRLIETLFQEHGIWIIGVAAMIEGLAVINIYFPGSLVILLAVTSSVGSPGVAATMVAMTMIGFGLAALVNYGLGFWGVHHFLLRIGGRAWFDQAQEWHRRFGPLMLLLTYFHPNLDATNPSNWTV